MKNNIFLNLLLVFIYSTLLVAENTFPNIGQGQYLNISLFLMIMLINYKIVNNYGEIFVYGFLTDSLNSNFSFGFFTCLFLVYLLISKNLNVGSFRELLFFILYGVHFVFTAMLLHSFSFLSLIINLLLYLFLRFVILVLLKK